MGTRSDVLILPPDFTRFHSQAGEITRFICEYYNFVPKEDDCDDEKTDRSVNESLSCPTIQIIPALGKITIHGDHDVSYHETSTLSIPTPNIPIFL